MAESARNQIDQQPVASVYSAKRFLLAVLARKWFVLGCLGVFFLIGLVMLARTPRSYTVELRVTPLISDQSRLTGRLSSLANLAGLTLPQDNNAMSFELYMQTLTSRKTADALAAKPGFLQKMFPGEWDAANHRWVQRRGRMAGMRDFVKSLLGMRTAAWRPPDGARVEGFLDNAIHVTRTPYTPVVTITGDFGDPEWGKYFFSILHATVDDALRQKKLARSTRYMNYLEAKLAATTVSDYREALINALSDQEKDRMMASAGLSYAAEPVEPPVASSSPTQPQASRIILKWVIYGGVLGVGWALLMDFMGWTWQSLLAKVTGGFARRRARAQFSPAGE